MNEMNEGVPEEYQKNPLKLITPPTDKQVSAIVNDEGPKEKKSMYERNHGEKCTLSFDGGRHLAWGLRVILLRSVRTFAFWRGGVEASYRE
jgi:hypothetical protein